MTAPTGLAFIGCGFVADLYIQTLEADSRIRVVGVYDRDPDRLQSFSSHYRLRAYPTRAALLADPAVAIVVNLTNPSSHYDVTRAALDAGKAVYSEKPLATTLDGALDLADRARAAGLGLATAPCNAQGPAVRTLVQAVRAGRIGRPLLAQAEMDDGMIPGLRTDTWRSASGAPWPTKDEFETGCVMEHAGYQIAPLVSLFGPVRRVTAVAGLRVPDKAPSLNLGPQGPDLSFGVLEFDDGCVARLSCSILAPTNRALRVVGEHGVLTLCDVWEFDSPVRLSPTGSGLGQRIRRKIESRVLSRWAPGILLGRPIAHPSGTGPGRLKGGGHRLDFGLGIAALADTLTTGASTAPMLDLAVHITEVTLALQAHPGSPHVHTVATSIPPRPA